MFPGGEFWNKEKRALWEVMAPFFIGLIYSGGESGAKLLPESVAIFMNWDVFNQDAIDYLRQYRLEWVNGISDTTRIHTEIAIQEWIITGEPKPVLDKRLAEILGPARAERIATTEVTRIYAEGNKLAWKSTGLVSGLKWQTAQDERVCPLCGPLHDQVISIDTVFTQSPNDIADSKQLKAIEKDEGARLQKANNLIRNSGSFFGGPPRHPNCRCWLIPVVSEAGLERELEKILQKAEIKALVAELFKDSRVVMVG